MAYNNNIHFVSIEASVGQDFRKGLVEWACLRLQSLGAGDGAAEKGALGGIGVGAVVKLERVSRQQERVLGQLGAGQARSSCGPRIALRGPSCGLLASSQHGGSKVVDSKTGQGSGMHVPEEEAEVVSPVELASRITRDTSPALYGPPGH